MSRGVDVTLQGQRAPVLRLLAESPGSAVGVGTSHAPLRAAGGVTRVSDVITADAVARWEKHGRPVSWRRMHAGMAQVGPALASTEQAALVDVAQRGPGCRRAR